VLGSGKEYPIDAPAMQRLDFRPVSDDPRQRHQLHEGRPLARAWIETTPARSGASGARSRGRGSKLGGGPGLGSLADLSPAHARAWMPSLSSRHWPRDGARVG